MKTCTFLGTTSLAALALSLAAGAGLVGQSPAEDLERGIHMEEALGDLEGAIALYERVAADEEALGSVRAQALQRLGECLLVLGRSAEARAAFARLIAEHPEEAALVAAARERIAAGGEPLELAPAPWKDGEILHLSLRMGKRTVGALFLEARSGTYEGRDAWLFLTRRYLGHGNQGNSEVWVDAETYRPFVSSFDHTVLGRFDAVYRPGEVVVTLEDEEPSTHSLESVAYDNEQGLQLMRQLPLRAVGDEVLVPFFVTFGCGKLPLEMSAASAETIETPAGTFECLELETSVWQTAWISNDERRRPVRYTEGNVTMLLESVRVPSPVKPDVLRDPDFGYSVAYPVGWYAARIEKPEKPRLSLAVFLAADENVGAALEVWKPRDGEPVLPVAERARGELEGARSSFTDYELREGSWVEWTVGGRPAIRFLGDYTEGGEVPSVQYRAYVEGERLSAEFILKAPRDILDEHADEFLSIVESWREEGFGR